METTTRRLSSMLRWCEFEVVDIRFLLDRRRLEQMGSLLLDRGKLERQEHLLLDRGRWNRRVSPC